MIDPFLDFFEGKRYTISQNLYSDAEDFKTYPDLPFLPFEKDIEQDDFLKILNERKSAKEYTKENLTKQTLSKIAQYSFSLRSGGRRPYPSGGGKYPNEVYFAFINDQEDVGSGIYHYDFENHGLNLIGPAKKEDVFSCFELSNSNHAIFSSSVLIFITFNKSRSIKKYGNLSYKLSLLEAGHIGQNIYLSCTYLGVGCRAHAGGSSEKINRLLRINGLDESVIYTFSLGYTA